MSRLIKAEYARLIHSCSFWLAVIATTFFGIASPVMQYFDLRQHPKVYQELDIAYRNIDGVLFTSSMLLMIILAVFMGIFISTEHSDGTIRNKIITGHKRSHIYLSKLIVCGTVGVSMNIYFILLLLLFGNILLEDSVMPLRDLSLFSACGSLFLIAAIALYLLLGMLIQNKAVNAVCILLLSFGMLFTALQLDYLLTAPEYYDSYTYINQDTGETEYIPREKNIKYPRGLKRKIYEKLYVSIPGCQIHQVQVQEKKRLAESSVYALLVIILSTSAGIVLFQRKDLK